MRDIGTKPMSLRSALLHFGIPAALVVFVVHALMPFLAARGLPVFFNFIVIYATLPMLVLIAASLVAYRREGNDLSWAAFSSRFRLGRMSGQAWLWTVGLTLFMTLSAALLSFTARWVASLSFLAPPDFWPAELRPMVPAEAAASALPGEFMGLPLVGNWWILAALMASLVIATLGEELWWRGYILPRQELAHGRRTWTIHGLLWTAFHLFAPWNLLVILPGCLALSYVAQRLQNTWPAIIAHGLANGLFVSIAVAAGIAR